MIEVLVNYKLDILSQLPSVQSQAVRNLIDQGYTEHGWIRHDDHQFRQLEDEAVAVWIPPQLFLDNLGNIHVQSPTYSVNGKQQQIPKYIGSIDNMGQPVKVFSETDFLNTATSYIPGVSLIHKDNHNPTEAQTYLNIAKELDLENYQIKPGELYVDRENETLAKMPSNESRVIIIIPSDKQKPYYQLADRYL